MIDKYRAILAVDPGSMVFVELAKAILGTGDFQAAIDTCSAGVERHPDSIVGYVLWGKGLIGIGDPSAAMDQFDRAIALDPDNPYAYNLIGEVLLEKQLYRSSLPILRKAVSLQPGDVRAREWLERAEGAVRDPDAATTTAPGSPPTDMSDVGDQTEQNMPSAEDHAALDAAFDQVAARSPGLDPGDDATELVTLPADRPAPKIDLSGILKKAGLTVASVKGHTDPGFHTGPRTGEFSAPPVLDPEDSPTEGRIAVESAFDSAFSQPDTDPAGEAPDEPGDGEGRAAIEDAFDSAFAVAGDAVPSDDHGIVRGMTADFRALETESSELETNADPFDAAIGRVPIVPGGPGDRDPTVTSTPPPAPPPLPPGGKPRKKQDTVTNLFGLNLPPKKGAERRTTSGEPKDKVVIRPAGTETAQVVAAEYERELRAKMLPADDGRRTFLQKNFKWLVLAGLLGLGGVTATLAILYQRAASRDENIATGLVAARNGLARHTYASYLATIDALDEVLDLDPDNTAAKAMRAEAQSILFAEFDRDPKRKELARRLISDAAVVKSHPDAVLDTRFHMMDDVARRALGPEVLSALEARPDSATLHYLAGRYFLAEKKTDEATVHFQAALKAESGHVRTVLALARFFGESDRWEDALQYYENVLSNYPEHVGAQIGSTEAMLALDRNLPGALATARTLREKQGATLSSEEETYLDYVHGRLFEKTGQHDKAVKRLEAALGRHPKRSDIAEKLARFHLGHFEIDRALSAVERASASAPGRVPLGVLEGEILLAGSRYRDATDRLSTLPRKDRRVARLQGIAAYYRGDLRTARRAFDRTRNEEGRMPSDAAMFLALTDAAAGDVDRARAVIDRATRVKRNDPLVLWALGRAEMARDNHRGAVRALQRAIKEDDRAYRAHGDLAQAQLRLGKPQKALASATAATDLNPFYREGLVLLGQLNLGIDEAGAAREAFQRVIDHHPADADANRGLGLAYLALGDLDQAETFVLEARTRRPRDGRNHHAVGRVYRARSEPAKAVRALTRASKLDAENADVHDDLGWVYLALGGRAKAGAAKKSFTRALELQRRSTSSRWGLGKALLVLKDKEAPAELNRAVSALRRSGSARERGEANLDLANAYLVAPKTPDLGRARRAAQSSVRADSTAQGHALLARILNDLERSALAIKQVDFVLALDPEHAEAHYELGRARDALGEYEMAGDAFQKYLKLQPRGRNARAARRWKPPPAAPE